MKKEKLVISIVIVISFLSISGCIEETSNDGNSSDNKKPNTVYVDANGSADFSSIQDAINNVADGDIIFVRNGIYNEVLKINKTINLIGENKHETIINFNRDVAGILKSTVLISADNCVLKEFKINSGELNENNQGIKVTSSNNVISDNIIIFGDDGINLDEGSKNNNVTRNSFSNSTKAIYLYYSEYNNISKNNFTSSSYYSIYAYGSGYNSIFNNNFSNTSNCVRLTGSDDNHVFGNNFINNAGGVLLCCGSKNNVVFYNNFIENHNFQASVGETLINQWNNESVGNYWDDYTEKYQNTTQENGIWQTPYEISSSSNKDMFPLVKPINI